MRWQALVSAARPGRACSSELASVGEGLNKPDDDRLEELFGCHAGSVPHEKGWLPVAFRRKDFSNAILAGSVTGSPSEGMHLAQSRY